MPKTHIYFGILFAGLIYLVFPVIGIVGFLVLLSASILIDIDHYSIYVWRKKDFSYKRSVEWFLDLQKKETFEKRVSPISLLHTVEVLAVIGVLAFFNQIFLFIFVAFMFHSICDTGLMVYEGKFFAREYSLIRYLKDYHHPRYI